MAMSGLLKKHFGRFDDTATITSQSTLGRDRHLKARLAGEMVKDQPLKTAAKPPSVRVELYDNGIVWLKPPSVRFPGQWFPLRDGCWSIITNPGTGELCMQTHFPLYFTLSPQSPKLTGQARTVYFEVQYQRQGPPDEENRVPNLHIGFVAKPYSRWRMPGCERGSIAVNCYDGQLLVNDEFNNRDFIDPIEAGDTIGIGLRFWPSTPGTKGKDSKLIVELFVTRNGKLDRTLPLNDEANNFGLTGDHDLYGAIGSLGEVSYLAVFKKDAWKFKELDSRPTTLPTSRPKAALASVPE